MTDIIPADDIYVGLTTTQINRVQQATKEIRLGARIAVRSMVGIGRRLKEIKAILTPTGQWRRWLQEEFDSSHDTADRYIRISDAFPNDSAIANFQKSALYLLAEQPQEVREVALERAAQGEQITRQVAEEISVAFQKAAVSVIEEAIATKGTVTLDNQSVTVVESMQQVLDADGTVKTYGTISKPVLEAAVAQTVAENLKADKDTIIRHITRKGQNKGKTEFLNWGTLSDFSTMMKSGVTQQFKGEIRVSVWGVPEVPQDE